MNIGFIGTGEISAAVIEGMLLENPSRTIVISPRSASVSSELAARHASVTRALDNQSVVDASDVVCLGIRPQQAREIIAPLRFRPDKILVSFIAGASTEELRNLLPEPRAICRVTPLPMIARRQGPILLYPDEPVVRDLFAPLGDLIVADSGDQMAAYGVASGAMSSFFVQMLVAIDWLAEHGVPREGARDYMMSMMSALGQTGARTNVADLTDLPRRHETVGGLNEACREKLSATGWFTAYADGLVAVRKRSAELSE